MEHPNEFKQLLRQILANECKPTLGKIFTYLMSFVLFMSLVSCAITYLGPPPPSATSSGPRTIVLDDLTISKEEVGGFTSWYCKDYTIGGPILTGTGSTRYQNLGPIYQRG